MTDVWELMKNDFANDKYLRNYNFDNADNAFVAKRHWHGKQIVGFCAIHNFDDPCKSHIGRLAIGVCSKFRGQGIGKMLAIRAIGEAFWQGKEKIWLTVYADNEHAIKLYESLGFKVEGVFRKEEFDTELGWRDVYSMALFNTDDDRVVHWGPPKIEAKEVDNLLKCVHYDWFSAGPQTASVKSKAQTITGAQHVVPINNGTSALIAVFKSILEWGDYVYMPNYTFVATYNAARIAGLQPILTDVNPMTGMIDLDEVKVDLRARIERNFTMPKAIVSVSVGGMPSDYEQLLQLKNEFGLTIIEDAAAGLGAQGAIPQFDVVDVATYSLHASKVVTAIEGGLIATNNETWAGKFRRFINNGESDTQKYRFGEFGLNMRPSDLHMGIADAQLDKIYEFIKHRNKVVRLYREILGKENFQAVPDYVKVHPYMFCLFFVTNKSKFMSDMMKLGVETRPAWYGIFDSKVYPNSKYIADHGVYLPVHNKLTEEELHRIVVAVNKCR